MYMICTQSNRIQNENCHQRINKLNLISEVTEVTIYISLRVDVKSKAYHITPIYIYIFILFKNNINVWVHLF